MRTRSLAPVVFTPILVFLAAMLAFAAFSLHPPLLGWIGLGLASLLALAVGALATRLAPRMGTNAERLHPLAGEVYRLLIVAAADLEPGELGPAVALRALGRRCEVRVVAPVIAGLLHFVTADERREQACAERRMRATLRELSAAGIDALGAVGTDDPLRAVADVLPGFPADEILFVGPLPSARGFAERRFEQRARDVLGVPVSTLYGSPSATARRKLDAVA